MHKENAFWEGDKLNHLTRKRPSAYTSYKMGKKSKKPAAKKASESPLSSDSEEMLSRPSTSFQAVKRAKKSSKSTSDSESESSDIVPSDSEAMTSATLEEMEAIDGTKKKKKKAAKKSKKAGEKDKREKAKKKKRERKKEVHEIKKKPSKKMAPPPTPHWDIAEDEDEETAEAIRERATG